MAVSKSGTQITWSASNSVSVSNGGNQTSDAVSLASTSFLASVTFKADNAGTPASGDTLDCHILYTTGDPDGASSDEYDTPSGQTLVAVLDTNEDDPAQITVPINAAAKGFKVYVENNAASNNITASAELYEVSG